MIRFTAALAVFAALTGAAGATVEETRSPADDPVICGSVQGFNLFIMRWKADLQSALKAQTIVPDVYDYLTRRADDLADSPNAQPGLAGMIRYCEDLRVLFPR